MPLPPGRARAFEAAGKQGCDCMAWSRKRRTGFISRQGVYENSRPPSNTPICGQSVPKMWPHSRKSHWIFFQNWNGREAILGLSRLDCLSARTGGTVNGGAFMRRSSCR
ncbi:hypothetical protein CLOSYM_03912 [[Clostridium] symbiosum ATCC 14940]|uniref:Uncharacterized protein n=1 Tax=[Clostridium] symbiosum ATCC 14940 TaxID=411472 RepID=A0ABC9TT87_CLOSY|nr:hypothetical protein CLOSYM_03912 [[Clostridium] symbiosum ATCC 14940]